MATITPRAHRRSPAARPTDGELLDAALAVFAEVEFTAATMDAIAHRADCTKPTLYAHFGSKDALYDEVVRRETDNLGAQLQQSYEAAADQRPREAIKITVAAFFDYAASKPDGFRLLFGDSNAIATPRGRALLEAATDGLARLAERTVGAPELHFSADMIAAMGIGVCIRGAYQALHDGLDLQAAGELAASYIEAADTGLDSRLLGLLEPRS
jgi:AcrR family transcriptional regulator